MKGETPGITVVAFQGIVLMIAVSAMKVRKSQLTFLSVILSTGSLYLYTPSSNWNVKTFGGFFKKYSTETSDSPLKFVDLLGKQTDPIPDDAYDNDEVLFLLRAIPFEVGYSATYTNVVPAAGLTPKATITVVGEEEVEAPFGSFNCYKLEISVLGTTQYLWYGVDSSHYLVKAEVEGIVMLLTEVSSQPEEGYWHK